MTETARTRKKIFGQSTDHGTGSAEKKNRNSERECDDVGELKKKTSGWQGEHMGRGLEKKFAGGLSPESGQIRSPGMVTGGEGRIFPGAVKSGHFRTRENRDCS
jgi:hypothetical protein